jgi:hypothetical protein
MSSAPVAALSNLARSGVTSAGKGKSMKRRIVLALVVAVAVCVATYERTLSAQGDSDLDVTRISINALINETEKRSELPDVFLKVRWFPEEYWRLTLLRDPNVSADQAIEVAKLLRPYLIIAVVDGVISSRGEARIEYKSETTVRRSIRVKNGQGNTYKPLEDREIDPNVTNYLSEFKPFLRAEFGRFGENTHLVLFQGETDKGEPIADAQKEATFFVEVGDSQYRFRTPLGSLLPQKRCGKCGDDVNGAYQFCPWDGTKLPPTRR